MIQQTTQQTKLFSLLAFNNINNSEMKRIGQMQVLAPDLAPQISTVLLAGAVKRADKDITNANLQTESALSAAEQALVTAAWHAGKDLSIDAASTVIRSVLEKSPEEQAASFSKVIAESLPSHKS